MANYYKELRNPLPACAHALVLMHLQENTRRIRAEFHLLIDIKKAQKNFKS